MTPCYGHDMTQVTANRIRPGDFLWRTPTSDSFTVASAASDGTTVEIVGEPNTWRGLATTRVWLRADAPVRVTR